MLMRGEDGGWVLANDGQKHWVRFQLPHWWNFTLAAAQEVGIEFKVKIYDF